MHSLALIPWLDPELIINAAGPWALLVVCFIVFAETGLLVSFLLPGDTLLIISGLLTHTNDIFGVNIWIVCLLIALAAFVGGEVGYLIGHKGGPAVFERKESGLFSRKKNPAADMRAEPLAERPRATATPMQRPVAQEPVAPPPGEDLFPDHGTDEQFEIPAFLRRQSN